MVNATWDWAIVFIYTYLVMHTKVASSFNDLSSNLTSTFFKRRWFNRQHCIYSEIEGLEVEHETQSPKSTFSKNRGTAFTVETIDFTRVSWRWRTFCFLPEAFWTQEARNRHKKEQNFAPFQWIGSSLAIIRWWRETGGFSHLYIFSTVHILYMCVYTTYLYIIYMYVPGCRWQMRV